MAREGVDLDMKLPSGPFNYEASRAILFAKRIVFEASYLKTSPDGSFMSRSTPSLAIARFLLQSSLRANGTGRV